MKTLSRWILPLLLLTSWLLVGGSRASFGQAVSSGDIRGTVTDTTGALVAGVTVTVLDVDTGVSRDFATNQDGLYDTSAIVAGHYKLTFKKTGFETFVRGPLTIDVGLTAVDAQLKIGDVSVAVTVTTDVPLLNTVSGDQTSTLEAQTMDQLPQVGTANNSGNSWENFITLLPGIAGTAGGQQGAASPGQEPSSNGNMPFSNVLSDGSSTTLDHSQNANPATFDDLAEVQISLSSFSAQYGVGGLIINQVTKGGTDKFHGTAYEYFMNNDLNAAPFEFGNTLTRAQAVPFLRYNDYGFTVGGPIAVGPFKKKAFFFFGYDRIDNNTNTSGFQTLPTAGVMAGNFNSTNGDNIAYYNLYDPTTQTIAHDSLGNPYPVRKTFASENPSLGNAIPAALQDSVSQKFQALFPTGSNDVGEYVSGTAKANFLQNNWHDSYAQPRPWRRYFGRMDYDINRNNRLTLVDNQGDELENGDNSVTACPIACQLGDVDNNTASITDVWNIGQRTINEARMGYTDQLNFFTDSTTGQDYPTKLGWQFAEYNILPNVTINNYYNLGPATNAIYKEMTFDPSDVVTMIRGNHVLHFGGELAFYRDDSTAWGNLHSGEFTYSGQYTQQWALSNANCPTGTPAADTCAAPNTATGSSYADFLLGYAQKWDAQNTPEFGARLKKPQMFVQDDWKARRNLTVNLGLRYEISHGYSEVKGNEASFDPTVTNTDGTLGAMWYGETHANGRTAMEANVFSTFMPRLGFSWQAIPKTTVRGGYGLYSYNFSLDNYASGMGSSVSSFGSYTDVSNGIYPVTKFNGTGTIFPLGGGPAGPLPYTAASTSPGRFNGSSTPAYSEFHTPVPKAEQWNFGVERELSTDYVVTLFYVGSHGFNLTMPTDLNAVPESKLSSNDAAARPYSNFTNITGNLYNAVSNYHSLQVAVTKRMSHGFSTSFNYTWSHMLDDMDSSGWGSHAGFQGWQHATSLTQNLTSLNYGPSNFDQRQALKGYVVYQLPFGKGKAFMNNNAITDAVLGGWQFAGTMLELAGNPFQPTVPNGGQLLYNLAGNSTQYPNRVSGVSLTPQGGKSWQHWFNEGAFSQAAVGAFGDAQRNPVVGPGINNFTLSGGKELSIWEQVKFSLRCDATNVFNHPSFSAVPGGSGNGNFGLTGGSAGAPFTGTSQLSNTSVGGRAVELSGRISF
ncbi:MAG: carboxypeptidase regulatory-like domain-containing protein [Terracidiphilus sp.]|jgi:hypothetical protein